MMIIGAGMAGLIAANMLRKTHVYIREAQASIPHNHEAVLRFRSTKVPEVTGIEFKKALVRKSMVCNNTYADQPNPYICNMYSLKVTGEISDRSIWNFDDDIRYIAPDDFVERMAHGINIEFNRKVGLDDIKRAKDSGVPVISTMPMPTLMKIVDWPNIPAFKYRPIWVIKCDIVEPKINVHQTIYFSDLEDPFYRATISGNHIVIEYIEAPRSPHEHFDKVIDFFGMNKPLIDAQSFKVTHQPFGKIIAIDDDLRQQFIYYMTREYNVYSLGRFAIWKQILLDDVVDDVNVIKKLIAAENKRSQYQRSLIEVKQ